MIYNFQLPSDIKAGTYVLRHELLALHANYPLMKYGPLGGPQFFIHCFNIEVTGSGTETPSGVTFSGAYKKTGPMITLDVHGYPEKAASYVRDI
jgi:lytic cellulose monooxygenase (C1-hydroxylating)